MNAILKIIEWPHNMSPGHRIAYWHILFYEIYQSKSEICKMVNKKLTVACPVGDFVDVS